MTNEPIPTDPESFDDGTLAPPPDKPMTPVLDPYIVTDDDDDDTETVTPDDVTDEDLHRLFPNPAGYFVAKVALESHLAYFDAHSATHPTETNVRENAWRKPYMIEADARMENDDHYGPFADIMHDAKTSDDPEHVAYIMAFADALKLAAKANMRGLYLASRHATRTVTTDAVDDDTLRSLLNVAEQNVTALIGLTANGMADEAAIWQVLPSKTRKVRVAKGTVDRGIVKRSYGPPLIPKGPKAVSSQDSTLRLMVDGEAIDTDIGAACKEYLGIPFTEVHTLYFDGKFTNKNIGQEFTHQGMPCRIMSLPGD